MRMIYSDRGPSPLDVQKPAGERDSTAGKWGAFSIETFASASSLRLTHEDATGFLAYLLQFSDRNFWFADAGVAVWAYEETYDNWQDRYGMDAVMAAYHSGHGTMLGDGTFVAPMGAKWDNRTDARSNTMKLGNEKVNYVFWSTCLSCRVLDGHSPVRTWGGPNLGFRMLFGFETVSIDNANYGKFFWEEWRKNKTFAQAWLDASWRIYTRQAPSVTACGATRDEAVNRLNTERLLSADHVHDDWYAWRWYNASTSAREATLDVPSQPSVVELAPRSPSEELAALGQRADFGQRSLAEVEIDRLGVASATEGERQIATGPQGNRWLKLADANLANREAIDEERAIDIARDFARRQHEQGLGQGAGQDSDLVLDGVHHLMQCCGSKDGKIEKPQRLETLVTFRQTFDGIPVVTPGRGEIRVSVDNDGTIVSAQLSTREAVRTSGRLKTAATEPSPQGAKLPSGSTPPLTPPEEALDAAQARLIAELDIRTPADGGIGRGEPVEVPGSKEVGYEIEGNEAYLAARKLVEFTDDNGYVSRHWVVAPLAR
ncbi:DUF6345 domain-containing protein [Streptomyces daliensis]|uniref:Uncharacterized protein n=1 Tax=Streptomyces daliensis TaxID=299421 RepID=A0A8T4IVF6_9ACTN|nr:hypothetical protein [Streptomyces daliensis]